MNIFLYQYPDGHEMVTAVFATVADLEHSAGLEGVPDEAVEALSEGESYYGECGETIEAIELPSLWGIAVTWEEPESGVRIHGPFGSEHLAQEAWHAGLFEQYQPDPDAGMPEDVTYEIQPLTSG